MEWNPAHLLWEQQVMLIWLVAPPIFVVAALLAFAGPLFARKRK